MENPENPTIPLPQETLENIIDFLHSDRPSLLACSLASPTLIPVCRYHLFSEAVLHPARIPAFLKLLGGPWCSFSRLVSRLVISGTGVCQRSVEQTSTSTRDPPRVAVNPQADPQVVPLFSPAYSSHPILRLRGLLASQSSRASASASQLDPSECSPSELDRAHARLYNLASIRFSGVSTRDLPSSFWRVLDGLEGITAAEIDGVTLHAPSSFIYHLASLPGLRSLSVSSLTASDSEGHGNAESGEADSLDPPKQLEQTQIFSLPVLDLRRTHTSLLFRNQGAPASRDARASTALLQWLLSHRAVPHTRTLKLNIDCEAEVRGPLERYVGAVGAGVREAWLLLPGSVTALQAMPPISFAPLAQIEVLHLEGLLMTHENAPQTETLQPFFRTLFAELSSASSSASSASSPSASTTTSSEEEEGGSLPHHPPSLRHLSISLTLETKAGAHSFWGIPDYILLQPFAWCGLPAIVEEAFAGTAPSSKGSPSSYPSSSHPSPSPPSSSSSPRDALKDLQVYLQLTAPGIAPSERGLAEEYVRQGAWKEFAERGRLRVGFVDGEGERTST